MARKSGEGKPRSGRGINSTQQTNHEELLEPSHDEARELCRLARAIQQLTPWEFMDEIDLFGVQDPESGEIGFVSVMGSIGEYLAIAVYRGSEGFYRWLEFHDELERDPNSQKARDLVVEIPQLQLHFSEPESLENRDRQTIKQSGIKFGSAKPMFRSYRPGYWPWFVTRAEARQLIHTLAQAIDIIHRYEEDPDLLPNEDHDPPTLLVRVPQIQGSGIVWSDKIRMIEPPASTLVPLAVDDQVITELRLFRKEGAIEIDIVSLPAKVGEEGERPQALFALLMADTPSEYLHGFEVLDAKDGIDLMYARVTEQVTRVLLKTEVVPEQFLIRSERLLDVLESLANELGIRASLVQQLPAIESVRRCSEGEELKSRCFLCGILPQISADNTDFIPVRACRNNPNLRASSVFSVSLW